MTEELAKAQDLLASGDVPGLLRQLRAHGDALPLAEAARLVAGAARLSEFDDLARAAATERDEGDDGAPPDPVESLRRFVAAVTTASARAADGGWLGGIREYIPNAGPVPSNRFL